MLSNDNSVVMRQSIQPDVKPLASNRLTQQVYFSY